MQILGTIGNVIGYGASLIALISYAIFLISLLVGVVVGAWDLLAWLTNSDWKTTHFTIPMLAGAGGIFSLFLWKVFTKMARSLIRDEFSK